MESTNMPNVYKSRKSKKTTWFLVRYLGFFGAHRFYAGRVISGFLYLFTFGLCFIGWSRDILAVYHNRFKDEIGHVIADTDDLDDEAD